MITLVRLLLLEPGTIQSHPECGVGLVSKYRYSVEGSASTLQSDFKNQIEKYLPQYQGVQVSVVLKDKAFYISAQIDNTLYAVYYETDTGTVNYNYSSLSDL